jgi:ornithine carbamoyltransferase
MSDSSASPIRSSLLPPGANLDCLAPGDLALVLANAQLLEGTISPLERRSLLRGKNLALICASADDAEALLFQQAALDLGAHLAHIRPDLSEPGDSPVFRHTARMLGRLYQAVECQGVKAPVVAELGREAGIPVYDALASRSHPLAHLARLLEGGEEDERNRRLIVQAVLVSTIG